MNDRTIELLAHLRAMERAAQARDLDAYQRAKQQARAILEAQS